MQSYKVLYVISMAWGVSLNAMVQSPEEVNAKTRIRRLSLRELESSSSEEKMEEIVNNTRRKHSQSEPNRKNEPDQKSALSELDQKNEPDRKPDSARRQSTGGAVVAKLLQREMPKN